MEATEFFEEAPSGKSTGYSMLNSLGVRKAAGDIGLEIEVEGNKFKKLDVPSPWAYHKDGSLRGKDNAEYVLQQPIKFDRVPEAINILWQMFGEYGSKLDESNRTSVHVHLNAQDFHLNRLTSFLGLYFSVEDLLTQWCGDHRVGNLFCLRAKDAPAIVSGLKRFIQTDTKDRNCISENFHYAGLNAYALFKFGSIEIRALRGCTDPDTILTWTSILERIHTLSKEFPDPRDIPPLLSSEGPMNYFDYVLGENASTVRRGLPLTEDQIRTSLYEGIRLAQDLCYCRDWSLFEPLEIESDPFGRRKTPLSNYLNTQHVADTQYYNMVTQAQHIYTPAPLAGAYAPEEEDDMPEPEYDPELEEDEDEI